MSTDQEEPYLEYKVEEQMGKYKITTSSGRTALSFRDENSASHYASLLNEAFQKGYKSGYRAGRKV